jgi:hypothetical protein
MKLEKDVLLCDVYTMRDCAEEDDYGEKNGFGVVAVTGPWRVESGWRGERGVESLRCFGGL